MFPSSFTTFKFTVTFATFLSIARKAVSCSEPPPEIEIGALAISCSNVVFLLLSKGSDTSVEEEAPCFNSSVIAVQSLSCIAESNTAASAFTSRGVKELF